MVPTLAYRNQAFINGRYVAAASGKTFDCVSPIDGTVLTQAAECDAADVDRAVAAARAHQLSRKLKAGTVVVNNVWGSDITNPFGGYKQSGIGRDKSLHAMDKYCQVKNTFVQL
jgi:acyl-CoA reductase-like NAD-dependent aldehyde dehydrogenase